MDQTACHCLLCQQPPDESAWDDRDRRIAGIVRAHGWNVTGVTGDERTAPWAYSIGLWHTLRSPEICVFGLSTDTGMTIVNTVGAQIRDGRPVRPDERRDDVLTDLDVTFRPVRPAWYHSFFGAAVDFYVAPPPPVVQLFWPDRQGRFPWEPDADPTVREQQPLLWMPPEEHPPGMWTEVDPYAGWPFRTSPPYLRVRAAPGVVDGRTEVTAVVRDPDGGWAFLDASGDGGATTETSLRHITNTHPQVAAVADLVAGERADRDPDGGWTRSP